MRRYLLITNSHIYSHAFLPESGYVLFTARLQRSIPLPHSPIKPEEQPLAHTGTRWPDLQGKRSSSKHNREQYHFNKILTNIKEHHSFKSTSYHIGDHAMRSTYVMRP